MMPRRRPLVTFARLTVLLALALLAPDFAEAARDPARVKLDGLRLPFIPNEGQVDARIAYYAPTFAGTFLVTRQGELVYTLPGSGAAAARASLTETLVGGTVRPEARHRSATGVGSFVGDDPARWRPSLPTYEWLGLGQVWPGVRVALQARGRSIEKVFTLEPGAPVDRIWVRVSGADTLAVDPAGALIAGTRGGAVTFTPPVAYQERGGVRRPVTVAYRLAGREYGFTVGEYDRRLPLVIDPVLQSTYVGAATNDRVNALAIHPSTGDVYVAGDASSVAPPGFPFGTQVFVARLNAALTTLIQTTFFGGATTLETTSATALAIHPTTGEVYVAGFTDSGTLPMTAGGAQEISGAFFDAFVARFDSALTTLGQATYLGGNRIDRAFALAIRQATGHVYVAGRTLSPNFPGTTGGAQPVFGGPGSVEPDFGADGFVAQLDSALTTLHQATYLGGGSEDEARALAISGATGEVFAAGQTFSMDFPGTAGGAQPASSGNPEAFVARLSSDLTTLGQATYFHATQFGSGLVERAQALAIHPTTNDVYVAGIGVVPDLLGQHAFVARFPASLTSLTGAIELTGSDTGNLRSGAFGVAIHPTTHEVYVAGSTEAPDFVGTAGGAQPNNAGGFDAFVARLAGDLTAVLQATYLGGSADDEAFALAIHAATGEVYVAGRTRSSNFPQTAGGAQPASGGNEDGFVSRLTSNLAGVPGPDLTVSKSHVGNFLRGQAGSYTLVVRNVGTLPTSGLVTVTDTLPASLTAAALGGPGWTCVLGTLTCTRADALAVAASYPAITLNVTVSATAPASVVNVAAVSGGGDVNPVNDTAADATAIVAPDLTIDKFHFTHFLRGQTGALYQMTVTNVGTAPTSGEVTVVDTLPAGLTATALTGVGWSCTLATLTCTRSDPVAPGAIYPSILLTVTVAADAPSFVVNTAVVSGGADITPANNTDADGTAIINFVDVPPGAPLGVWIDALVKAGLSDGCLETPPLYCPNHGATRAQLAVFFVRAINGGGFAPPPATGTVFTDVPASHPLAKWIEAAAAQNLLAGCTPTTFCPDVTPTRGQMAMLLLLARHGPGFTPPPATGTVFADVAAAHPFAQWIEQLRREAITGGCTPATYCPDRPVTRAETAVFVIRTFDLPM